MANRTIRDGQVLAAGSQAVFNSQPIPNALEVVIENILLTDMAVADGKSVAYKIEWGTPGVPASFVTIIVLHSNGQSIVIPIGDVLIGDGNKVLRVTMFNASAQQRFAGWRMNVHDAL